jgi:hypothetical protein
MTYLQAWGQFDVIQKAQYVDQHYVKSPIGEKLAQGDLLLPSATAFPKIKGHSHLVFALCTGR